MEEKMDTRTRKDMSGKNNKHENGTKQKRRQQQTWKQNKDERKTEIQQKPKEQKIETASAPAWFGGFQFCLKFSTRVTTL